MNGKTCKLLATIGCAGRMIPTLISIVFAFDVLATPSITVNHVRQRYPWNGMVDVDYTVSGIDTSHSYYLRFKVTTSANVSKSLSAFGAPTANGTFTTTFNAADADAFPEMFDRNCTVTAQLFDYGVGGAIPLLGDAAGTPINVHGDVMVIDVSAGASAGEYPVYYHNNVDIGRFNCSAYKTGKIVLRKVPAGSYSVGDDNYYFYTLDDDDGDPFHYVFNRRRTATTAGYYIGVFPVTQKQYDNVMGRNNNPAFRKTDIPGNPASERPVENVSWYALRDSATPDSSVTASSNGGFIARLLSKAKSFGTTVGGFDLPTEFQWEIACRAGTTTHYYWGDSEALIDNYAWYHDNSAGTPHAVGQKLPNGWGLYDCCGNVEEWCRDAWDAETIASGTDADLVSAYGGEYNERVERGGCWSNEKYKLCSFYRYSYYPDHPDVFDGFRLSRTACVSTLLSTDPAVYVSDSTALALDTRTGLRIIESAADVLPITYSATDWGAGSGLVTVKVHSAGVESIKVISPFHDLQHSYNWSPSGSGYYELIHESNVPGAKKLTAPFSWPEKSSSLPLELDTRTGPRTVCYREDLLKFAVSGTDFGRGFGIGSLSRIREDNVVCWVESASGTTVYDEVYDFLSEGEHTYDFTLTSTVPGATTLTARFIVTPPVPKAVVNGSTLTFVCDYESYGTNGVNWFAVNGDEDSTENPSWHSLTGLVTKVVFDSSFSRYQPSHCGHWFDGFCHVNTISGLEYLDVSRANNLQYMFAGCSSLVILDLSSFDTDNVEFMLRMFDGCTSLSTIYVGNTFSTAELGDYMNRTMFYGCTSLVGGNGTVYTPEDTTARYAHIDAPANPGYLTYKSPGVTLYEIWAASKGLTGANAAWDAKPSMWGGNWANAFIYTYGEGLADGTLSIMGIRIGEDGKPIITTVPVVPGHTGFNSVVIGSQELQDWTLPVILENSSDNEWTLPAEEVARFFRVRLIAE